MKTSPQRWQPPDSNPYEGASPARRLQTRTGQSADPRHPVWDAAGPTMGLVLTQQYVGTQAILPDDLLPGA